MIDKRALMRDYRVARMGLSRRIRLRIRSTNAPSVASVDPLSGAAPSQDTDKIKIVSGQFTLLKSDQQYAETGVIQNERGIVYFPAIYKSLVEDSYSMYIGASNKEWVRRSVPQWDDARCAIKVYVEAQQ